MTKPKTNRMRELIITRPIASMLLRVFDLAYKMGVRDAFEADDDGQCREFLRRMETPGLFGRVIDDTTDDWLYWAITLKKEIVADSLYKSAYKSFDAYARNAGTLYRNYLGVAYIIAHRQYIGGVEDWLQTHEQDLALFNGQPKVRLTKKGPKARKPCDYISDIQLDTFRACKVYEEAGLYPMRERHFDMFRKAISLASEAAWDSIS